MKILSFAPLLLLVPSAFAPVQQDLEEDELEQKVAALEDELATLKESRMQDKALLEQVLLYLDAQSQEGAKMLATLDESEQLGFTAGINFRSREVLLSGMRTYWTEVQKGVPKPAPKKAESKPAPPARQRSGT